jgi:hypothetical protein
MAKVTRGSTEVSDDSFVVAYRRVIEVQDTARSESSKQELLRIAERMRAAWMKLAGQDNLHETAFEELPMSQN